jgi:hypothetical protein
VTFSVNDSNAAKETSVTLKKAGTYVFRLRVAHGSSSSYADVTVTAEQVAKGITVSGPSSLKVIAGDTFDVYARVVDQFGYPMPTQPTITWSSTNSGISFATPTGQANKVRVGTAGGGAITAKATVGATQLSGTLSGTISITPNTPPTCAITVSRSSATAPIQLTLTAKDTEDTRAILLTYKWEVVSTPSGKTFALSNDYFPVVLGTPSGAGAYQVKATVTDGGGLTATTTISFSVATDGTVASGNTPKFTLQPKNVTVPAENTQYMSTYCVQSYAGAVSAGVRYQWQFSTDEGINWENVSESHYGAHGPSYYLYATLDASRMYPLNSSDSGKLFRVIATNTSGSAYGNVARLTVSGPAEGIVEIWPTTTSLTRDAGQVVLRLKRAYGSTGASTITYRIDDAGGTAKYGRDYGLPTTPAGASATTTSGVTVITGTAQWAAGDSADKLITIPILQNSTSREFRTLNVTISGTTASKYVKQAAVSVVSDVYFDAELYPVRADNGSATLTLHRQPSSTGSLTVNYAAKKASGDTAIAGADFVAATGTVTWADGDYSPQTITIPILQNAIYKNDRVFSVDVSFPGSGIADGMASAQVAITDAPAQSWQRGWWPETSNPNIVGDSADPDGDGLTNLLERGLGSNPTLVSPSPTVEAVDDHLQITFTRSRDAGDLVFFVDGGDDLSAWSTIWNSIGVPYGGGTEDLEELTIVDPVSLSDPASIRRFLRLRVLK